MPFFQNLFTSDFEGNWVLGDRQHSPKFVCPRNAGRADENVVAWNDGPYDLSGNDTEGNSRANLTIQYALRDLRNWASVTVDVTDGAADSAAVTTGEIAAALNANAIFSERFTATVGSYDKSTSPRLMIRQKKPATEFRFYVVNGTAEEALGFNQRAGVAELPTYFARHTIANRFTYEDAQNHLIQLDTTNNVDAAVITGAVDAFGKSKGFTATAQADYALLEGRSGIFQFVKGPGAAPVTATETVIYYSAGAKAGDLAKKVVTQKNTNGLVVAQFELPYTLVSDDIVTPP